MQVTNELLTIGRFARVSGLTVKALRHYDEIGLLVPAEIDPATGYRRYALEQARRAEAIRRLRSLELPLDEIAVLLRASPDGVREGLLLHRSRLEGQAVETRRILYELTRLIDGEEELVPDASKTNMRFELGIEEVPEQHVLVIAERVPLERLTEVVPRAIDEVHSYLEEAGRKPAGPPVCVCPFPDDEGLVDSETGWLVDPDVPGRGNIEARTLPATRALVLKHDGPYSELGRSYRLLSEMMERGGLTPAGPPRELYLTDPAQTPDPSDYETRIVWPVGPEGGLDESRDILVRRVDV